MPISDRTAPIEVGLDRLHLLAVRPRTSSGERRPNRNADVSRGASRIVGTVGRARPEYSARMRRSRDSLRSSHSMIAGSPSLTGRCARAPQDSRTKGCHQMQPGDVRRTAGPPLLYGGQRPQGDLSVGGEQGGRGIGRGEKVQRVPAAVIHAPVGSKPDRSPVRIPHELVHIHLGFHVQSSAAAGW